MILWTSTDNILGTNFNLYSSLQDALNDINPWLFCNYDDYSFRGIGKSAFLDCGPEGEVPGQWCSNARDDRDCRFSVYNPQETTKNKYNYKGIHLFTPYISGFFFHQNNNIQQRVLIFLVLCH